MKISESSDYISAYAAYAICRNRDLCLRMMGETPLEWADCTVTPCPCDREHEKRLEAYARVLHLEDERGRPFPYTHKRLVNWTVEEKFPKNETKLPKKKVFPSSGLITQARIEGFG